MMRRSRLRMERRIIRLLRAWKSKARILVNGRLMRRMEARRLLWVMSGWLMLRVVRPWRAVARRQLVPVVVWLVHDVCRGR